MVNPRILSDAILNVAALTRGLLQVSRWEPEGSSNVRRGMAQLIDTSGGEVDGGAEAQQG
jgi:hypothetical protein